MNKARILLLLLACVSPLSAQSPQGKVDQRFVGAWRLASVEGTDAVHHFAYDHPTGILIYDRSGWMSVQIDVKGTRKPFVNGTAGGTTDEKVFAFDNYLGYYGTFSVDLKEHTVTHHLEDCSEPNRRGADNVRWFEFQGNDRLTLTPREDGKGGVLDRNKATYKLHWERIK
jgi:hypothetical protein